MPAPIIIWWHVLFLFDTLRMILPTSDTWQVMRGRKVRKPMGEKETTRMKTENRGSEDWACPIATRCG